MVTKDYTMSMEIVSNHNATEKLRCYLELLKFVEHLYKSLENLLFLFPQGLVAE